MPSLIKMGRKDSDYLLNLQEEIEKSAFFNQMFGYVGRYGYLYRLTELLKLMLQAILTKYCLLFISLSLRRFGAKMRKTSAKTQFFENLIGTIMEKCYICTQ